MNKDVHTHPGFGQIGSCSPCWGFCLCGRWEHVRINMKDVLNMPAVCLGLDYCAYCVCVWKLMLEMQPRFSCFINLLQGRYGKDPAPLSPFLSLLCFVICACNLLILSQSKLGLNRGNLVGLGCPTWLGSKLLMKGCRDSGGVLGQNWYHLSLRCCPPKWLLNFTGSPASLLAPASCCIFISFALFFYCSEPFCAVVCKMAVCASVFQWFGKTEADRQEKAINGYGKLPKSVHTQRHQQIKRHTCRQTLDGQTGGDRGW